MQLQFKKKLFANHYLERRLPNANFSTRNASSLIDFLPRDCATQGLLRVFSQIRIATLRTIILQELLQDGT